MNILVTGGAGFIGSHLVDALVKKEHTVTVLDNFDPQVHENVGNPWCNPAARYVAGDVRNYADVSFALEGVEVVYHLAASVGVGQSMYQIYNYVDNNCRGTALLLQKILECKEQIKRIVVASSMSIYGEGSYFCYQCNAETHAQVRSVQQLLSNQWEPLCRVCHHALSAMATPESKPLAPTSVYAVTKRDQEELCLSFGAAYKIPTTALRFFGVYGPRQSLSNPYTGVGAVFSSRLLNHKPPLVFEDGLQTRDFVHVDDIVQALTLSLEVDRPGSEVYNVGTGARTSVLKLAQLIKQRLQAVRELDAQVQDDLESARSPEPAILNKFREGDIRHCFADISLINKRLGYVPQVPIERGVNDLVEWVKDKTANDRVEEATQELTANGLL